MINYEYRYIKLKYELNLIIKLYDIISKKIFILIDNSLSNRNWHRIKNYINKKVD